MPTWPWPPATFQNTNTPAGGGLSPRCAMPRRTASRQLAIAVGKPLDAPNWRRTQLSQCPVKPRLRARLVVRALVDVRLADGRLAWATAGAADAGTASATVAAPPTSRVDATTRPRKGNEIFMGVWRSFGRGRRP